jgi:hypothetical protein
MISWTLALGFLIFIGSFTMVESICYYHGPNPESAWIFGLIAAVIATFIYSFII